MVGGCPVEDMELDRDFWRGRSVLVTGHTGFKGVWLSTWLTMNGAIVSGFALAPEGNENLHDKVSLSDKIDSSVIANISDVDALRNLVTNAQPEVIFHMAAQALVRKSYNDPVQTFQTNVMGTVNLLEVVRQAGCVKSLVIVTSDKCYEESSRAGGVVESDILGGHDPYSASKACVEILTASWRKSWFASLGGDPAESPGVATARAGNVIGGGDWAVDRLVPDMIRAKYSGEKFSIRYPDAVRPWQHVLEPIAGYMILAQRLFENKTGVDEAWNFGPDDISCQPVRKVVEIVANQLGLAIELPNRNSADAPHETHLLKLNSAKARSRLGWRPVLSLEEALDQTCNWYEACYRGQDMYDVSCQQILAYQRAAINQA